MSSSPPPPPSSAAIGSGNKKRLSSPPSPEVIQSPPSPSTTAIASEIAKQMSSPPPPPLLLPPPPIRPPPPKGPSVAPAPTTIQNGGTPSPPPPAKNGGSPALSPMQSRGGSTAALVAGVVVGGVVFLAVVAALVFFWFKRHQNKVGGAKETPAAGDCALPPEAASSFHSLESQIAKEISGLWTSEKAKEVVGNINEPFKLSPLQSPKAQSSQEVLQISGSQLHSASTSSSLSTGDNAQPPLVSVGVKAFGYEELSQATNRFSQNSFLGRGGFGSVYKGVLSNSDDVAIKVLQTGSFQGDREFVTEINVISRVHHRNLVSLVGYCVSGPERLLVYEYVENNNLAFHLLGSETPALDWATRMSIALGAAKGIAYLHEECHPRIIHRDIKSTNILLDSNFKVKVADFGLAKFVPDDQTHVTTRVLGTFGYLAPEFGSSGRLTEKSDVFSFGVVLLELITGRQPINLVEWVSPLLDQALEDGKFTSELLDPKLADNYDYEEMKRIVTCAAISVHRFPNHRPRMSQVVHVLEGNISPEKLMAETTRPRIRQSS